MRMFPLLVFVLFLSSFRNSFALSHEDKGKITNIICEYVEAWNHFSGRGFADNFCLNSDFINIFGMHFRGKEAIQNRHDEIHDTFLKNSIFTITDLELREVKSDLVMAFVRWKVEGFRKPETEPDGPRETITGIFSHVFINNNGLWEITATQNTLSK